ncbi:MAG: hypothetical protein U0521_29065 [Anaerolineae bacterium]
MTRHIQRTWGDSYGYLLAVATGRAEIMVRSERCGAVGLRAVRGYPAGSGRHVYRLARHGDDTRQRSVATNGALFVR